MHSVIASIPYPQIDPVLFKLGPLAVKWYGLAYLAGFALAYVGLRRLVEAGRLRVTAEALSDLLSWLVVGVIAGGRAGWWLFYHRAGGAEPWYEPLAIWHGGMSFHGGLVGVAAALFVWAWRHGAPFWNLADGLAIVAPVGLFLGRIANFINAELVGRPTRLPWGVIFPGEVVPRHASQLYEAALEGPVLLLVLWLARRRGRWRDGQSAALFLTAYGMFRFLVEFTRQPDDQIGFVAFGWLTMGQALSASLLVFGVLLWLSLRCRERRAGVPDLAEHSHRARVTHEAASART